jgi:hypothetical protein
MREFAARMFLAFVYVAALAVVALDVFYWRP